MKKFSLLLIVLFVSAGFAGSVLAGKNAKTIRHCGCVYDSLTGVDMIFHDITVAGKSQGHRNHVAGSDDACFAGLDDNGEATYELWVRDADDCMVTGSNTNLDACGDLGPAEFDSCGAPAPADG
jgi:hypothetical protein